MGREIYDENFYIANAPGSYRSARLILPFLFQKLNIESVADFGCGTGCWLKVAEDLGAKVIQGCDFGDNGKQLFIKNEQFLHKDLTQPIDLGRRYDLVMSLEVAEHLPKSAAENFIQTLCRHSNRILFSAALPGQGGTDISMNSH